MKPKTILAIAIILLAIIMLTQFDSDDKDNLILNGNFKSGLQHWISDDGISSSKYGGKKLTQAIKMQATYKENKTYIYEAVTKQCVSLKNNTSEFFKLEADVRLIELPKHLSSHRIDVTWFEGDNCTAGGQFGWFIEPKAESAWQHVVKDDLRRSLGSQSVLIKIVQNRSTSLIANNDKNSQELATAYWDNVKLSSKLTASYSDELVSVPESKKNYILNPDFSENGFWKMSTHSVVSSYVDFEGKSNSRAFKTNLVHNKESGIGLGASNQCVNIPLNKSFELGISYRVDNGSTQNGGGRLRPTWYKFQNCKGASRTSGQHADVKESYEWVDLKIKNLVAPENVQSVKVELIQTIKGKGEFAIIWDDAYLSEKELN